MERKTLEELQDIEAKSMTYVFSDWYNHYKSFDDLKEHRRATTYEREIKDGEVQTCKLKALERYHKQEMAFMQGEIDSMAWVKEGNPICFESGNWDGKRSDLVLVETKQGRFYIARMYSGTMDGSTFNDWCDQNDAYLQDIIQWKIIK